ncbi:hypothetical protein [Actinomadura harenae]|nr:hypothetical protein [Actinomadura harenae]
MSPALVELEPPASVVADEEEVVFMPDMDTIASAEVMLGCGDDNPY